MAETLRGRIARLEKELAEATHLNEMIIHDNKRLSETLDRIQDSINVDFAESTYCKQLKAENAMLKNKMALLERIIEKRKSGIAWTKNERGAGRKKHDAKWTASYREFVALYEAKASLDEVIQKMGISRRTYYRYKNIYLMARE